MALQLHEKHDTDRPDHPARDLAPGSRALPALHLSDSAGPLRESRGTRPFKVAWSLTVGPIAMGKVGSFPVTEIERVLRYCRFSHARCR